MLLRLLFVLTVFGAIVSALIFDVESGRSRCIQEVLAKHDLVKASYALLGEATEGERSGFTIKVRAGATSTGLPLICSRS